MSANVAAEEVSWEQGRETVLTLQRSLRDRFGLNGLRMTSSA